MKKTGKTSFISLEEKSQSEIELDADMIVWQKMHEFNQKLIKLNSIVVDFHRKIYGNSNGTILNYNSPAPYVYSIMRRENAYHIVKEFVQLKGASSYDTHTPHPTIEIFGTVFFGVIGNHIYADGRLGRIESRTPEEALKLLEPVLNDLVIIETNYYERLEREIGQYQI